MDYAILSDIHGNRPALEAVLTDIKGRGIEKIINLGDFFFGAIDPAGTAELILPMKTVATISGNKDRDTVEAAAVAKSAGEAMRFVLQNTTGGALQFLRNLPKTARVDGIFFACHGTPGDDNTYLTENVDDDGNVTLKSDGELLLQLKNVQEPVVLCGHSHVQRLIRLSNGQIILNPGSVGLPAYVGSDSPAVMESYTPFAKYAVVHVADPQVITFSLVSCPYNWEKSSALARENGNSNWAEWIKTGRALKKR